MAETAAASPDASKHARLGALIAALTVLLSDEADVPIEAAAEPDYVRV